MSAPTSPPATSVALTAAQLIAELKTPTGNLYAYLDPSVNQAPGYASTTAEVLLPVPGAATALTGQTLLDLINTPGTNKLFAFKHASDTRSPGFNASVMTLDAETGFNPYTGPVVQVIVAQLSGVQLYNSASRTDQAGVKLDQNTVLVVNEALFLADGQAYFVIANGTHSGKYIRLEDVKTPFTP